MLCEMLCCDDDTREGSFSFYVRTCLYVVQSHMEHHSIHSAWHKIFHFKNNMMLLSRHTYYTLAIIIIKEVR